MPEPKPPYPAAFRQQIVELIRAGRGVSEVARGFGCKASSVQAWLKADGVRSKRSANPPSRLILSLATLRRSGSGGLPKAAVSPPCVGALPAAPCLPGRFAV